MTALGRSSVVRGEPCDGSNPMTERPCVLGYHADCHRDATGAECLDE
jgi:hypothetical protein